MQGVTVRNEQNKTMSGCGELGRSRLPVGMVMYGHYSWCLDNQTSVLPVGGECKTYLHQAEDDSGVEPPHPAFFLGGARPC